MALVNLDAVGTTPETNLTHALHDFEQVLSPEDRIQLRSQGIPDARDAIRLTTLIDSRSNDYRRQCMGPRLITFLESIQQFSQVVDVFVSSHPEFAALVWGGVKFTLLAANNFTSYFDQLSTLLMNIGRQCPRMYELGSVYPTEGLRKALCDYYAAVIRLCKKITQSLGKPVYTQLSKALLVSFKAEYGPFQDEIAQSSQAVRDESSLALLRAQKLESELQANERLKAKKYRQKVLNIGHRVKQTNEQSRNWQLQNDHRKLEQVKGKALKCLSTYNYQGTYKQLCKECTHDTALWIHKDPNFGAWIASDSQVLRLTGRLGSGKSVISARVITHLIDTILPNDVIAFFFCRFDNQESLRERTIVGSIMRQMTSNLPAKMFRQFDLEDIERSPPVEVFEKILDHRCQYFIVLDGLDECTETQLKALTETLCSLLNSSRLRIKLFWSSRPHTSDWLANKPLKQRYIDMDSDPNQAEVAKDIHQFLWKTLEEWLEGETPSFRITDPALIVTILDRLEGKAQGMFLWVKLQLETLRVKKSDKQILDALNCLPRDLPETFARILSYYSDSDDIDIGARIFRWVAAAKRPLTLDELQEAIGIEPLQEAWDAQCFISNIEEAIKCCGNLVFINEEERTVCFTHASVKQYMCSEPIRQSLKEYSIDLESANAQIGVICVTYLNFPVFKKQVARSSGTSLNTSNITAMAIQNALPTGNVANRVALRLLRHKDKSSKSVQRLLEEANSDTESYRQQASLRQYVFESYARQFWLEHTKQKISQDSKVWRLWRRLIEEAGGRNTLSYVPWSFEDWNKKSTNLIDWIVTNNHCSLAQLMLTSTEEKLSWESTKKSTRILTEKAASKGQMQLLEIIWDCYNESEWILALTLQLGANTGQITIVERLLQKGANVNAAAAEPFGQTALQAAATKGHLAILERLLQEGANVNAAAAQPFGQTALQVAAKGGHLAIVERLLQKGADVNAAAAEDRGVTALQAAAAGGYLPIVERLLQKGADVNAAAAEHGGITALQAAAKGGHLAIVERLLQKGADVNAAAAESRGVTALQAAAAGGYLPIVERLLQKGADVNAAAAYGGVTALQAAAEGGHLTIIEMLLQEGADVNAAVEFDRVTALYAAAEEGHHAIVERLLQEGANVKAANRNGRTALRAAAEGGHHAVVEKLRAAGARK